MEEKKMRKQRLMKAVVLASALGLALTGCGKEEAASTAASTAAPVTEKTEEVTTEGDSSETEASTETTEAETEAATEGQGEGEMVIPEGYTLYWHDEFDQYEGRLSDEDWNYEVHPAGWVNAELQRYEDDEKYAYVKNGELVIQSLKEVDDDGNVTYVSGRVTTQHKHALKYGYIEARLKVPTGKGFLPAFWMMPEEEAHYGQWPKCGEIDIMEVLGNSTNMNYGTLHFGEPHKQNQGSYTLASGDFHSEYHTFAVEWTPNSFKWYVDGQLYYECNDWYTNDSAGNPIADYPAPFNQQFHVILNVAVGGNWPGDPDDSTIFDEENSSMKIDYVRMFRKKNYNENVSKPVREMHFKEADATGNFVTNGDFAEAEDLTDDTDWKFLELMDGKGSAKIENGEIVISTDNYGTEEYSIQLVQPGMPMVKGKKYKYSFEAYADEDRKMKAAVTAPTADWIRYFDDTTVNLTKDWQEFSFTFDMDKADDDAGRVEFNMGNQGSTATIHIRNVRLEEVE